MIQIFSRTGCGVHLETLVPHVPHLPKQKKTQCFGDGGDIEKFDFQADSLPKKVGYWSLHLEMTERNLPLGPRGIAVTFSTTTDTLSPTFLRKLRTR
jgi:hypothetical protein